MNYISHIKNSLQNSRMVLDLWCGKWFFSILAASYGTKVIAVDEQSMTKKFKISPYMFDHPHITYIEWDLKDQSLYNFQKYDCILLRNVIMFLKYGYVMNELLPLLSNILTDQWLLYFTFFGEMDVIQNSWNKRILHCYTSNEIYALFPDCEIIEEQFDENGNNHHIFHVFVIKK